MRTKHQIQVYRHAENGVLPWLSPSQAAAAVGITPKTLRLAADRGEIAALHPLADGPLIFRRADLAGSAAIHLLERLGIGQKPPAGPGLAQQNLPLSTT